MSPGHTLIGLIIGALAAFAGVLAIDAGSVFPVGREALVLVVLAATGLAAQSALSLRAARGQPARVLFVREGGIQGSGGQAAGANRLGSLSLAVESGQAVVLERNGLFSRILSPGVSNLRPGETVYKIVSTQARSLSGVAICTTRDGISVTTHFEVSSQIMTGAGDEPPGGEDAYSMRRSRLPPSLPVEPRWSEDALVRAAYETHTWESAVLSLARSVLREQLARSYLSDFLLDSATGRGISSLESLEVRCRRRLSTSCGLLGISVQRFRIDNLAVPPLLAGFYAFPSRHRPPVEPDSGEVSADNDLSGQRPTSIRLASVLAGGPFATFRQAMRANPGAVVIPDVLMEGHRWVGRSLGNSDSVAFELHPDSTHYDIQIHGQMFQTACLSDGDHLLFASLPEPVDGDIVAVAVGGLLEIRRFWQKTDHVLLAPERESQPLVALVNSDGLASAVRARYGAAGSAIEVQHVSAVKILGRAAIAFRRQSAVERTSAAQGMRTPPDSEHTKASNCDDSAASGPGDGMNGDEKADGTS